jgi:hypothetical protein
MLNIYNGNATTNDSGEAVVQLPDYFEALNRDFRYQARAIEGLATGAVYCEGRMRGLARM